MSPLKIFVLQWDVKDLSLVWKITHHKFFIRLSLDIFGLFVISVLVLLVTKVTNVH